MTIVPDEKDWTWVLDQRCPECGYDAAAVDRVTLGDVIRLNAAVWRGVLAVGDPRQRPLPTIWSPLEYAAHVRDVHRVFASRVEAMLRQEDPVFENWDQDATAVQDDYAAQDPRTVAQELSAAAEEVAATYDGVAGRQWHRSGRRSNGSVFTIDSLARYHLHDVVHHAWDVRAVAQAATVAAYGVDAAAYAGAGTVPPGWAAATYDRFVAALPVGARVLEIGSGPGRDADALEARGLRVRRTDISPGFVDLLRAAGREAWLVDPLIDDLWDDTAVPYDGVWASASLLHVARADLAVVLTRLARVTRPAGALQLALKEGDGDRWSVHGQVRGARLFVLWREEPLRAALTAAGWQVTSLTHEESADGTRWLEVLARRVDA